MSATTKRIYVFKGFERFWHWAQAGLIILLLLTGFEVHGAWKFFGFAQATRLHVIGAWSLVGLWVFAIFWHVTTGEWRQYIPTMKKIDVMIKFYSKGIFEGAPHPFRITAQKKHNPLQRLTYLAILTLVMPLIWVTGWFYLFYGSWQAWGVDKYLSLEWIAFFHTAGAFIILAFLVSHLYLVTTGHTMTSQVKAMITGWDEVEADDAAGETAPEA